VDDDCNLHGLILSTEQDLELDLWAAGFSNDANRLLLVQNKAMLPNGHTNYPLRGKLVVKVNPYLMVARFSLTNCQHQGHITTTE
jgi:hypothetical protein